MRHAVVAFRGIAQNPAEFLHGLELPCQRAWVHAHPLGQSLLRNGVFLGVQRQQDAPARQWQSDTLLERGRIGAVGPPELLQDCKALSLQFHPFSQIQGSGRLRLPLPRHLSPLPWPAAARRAPA
ncbi:hypothetical protein AWV80_31115 [Cupriavidus sp. UYMU48A]|nr:hypothetical protein AWV80_31115 [Cupriavidus sp. UYMU48A]